MKNQFIEIICKNISSNKDEKISLNKNCITQISTTKGQDKKFYTCINTNIIGNYGKEGLPSFNYYMIEESYDSLLKRLESTTE